MIKEALVSPTPVSSASLPEDVAWVKNGLLEHPSEAESSVSHCFFLDWKNVHSQKPACLALSDSHLFVGGIGLSSAITVWEICHGFLGFVGELNYLVGSPTQLKLNHDSTKLVVCTMPGYIYVWDVSTPKLEALRAAANEVTRGNYIPESKRVKPIGRITPQFSRECASIDFLQDESCLIGVGKLPDLPIQIYCIETNRKIATIQDLSTKVLDSHHSNQPTKYRRKMFEFNCISVDKQSYSLKNQHGEKSAGYWVGVGDSNGTCGIFFVFDSVLRSVLHAHRKSIAKESSSTEEHFIRNLEVPHSVLQLCHGSVEINSIAWLPRTDPSQKLSLICGCSDGFIRYVYAKFNKDATIELIPSYIQKIIRGECLGEVRRICVTQGRNDSTVVLAACNMTKRTDVRFKRDVQGDDDSVADDPYLDSIFETRGRRTDGKEITSVLYQHHDQIVDLNASQCGNYVASISLDKTVSIYSSILSKAIS